MHFVQTRAFTQHRQDDPQRLVVTDLDTYRAMMNELRSSRRIMSDTETSGTAWMKHARIAGCAWATWRPWGGSGYWQSWYVPIRHATGEQQLPEDVVLQGAKELLEHQGIEKGFWNKKFDEHMFRNEGIHVLGPTRDGMIESHLHDENSSNGLKECVAVDLGDPSAFVYESLLDNEVRRLAKEAKLGVKEYKNRYGYAHLPIHLAGRYACFDVEFTGRLCDHYDHVGVRQQFASTYQTEIDLVSVLVDLERNGLDVDVAYLERLRGVLEQQEASLAPRIFQACGMSFNLGSDEELRWMLLNRCGLPLTKLTKGGIKALREARKQGYKLRDLTKFLSVDKEVLAEFAGWHPAVELIHEWKTANKIRTTYTDAIIDRIGWDGRLHCDFQQVGTDTGRLSSRDPNFQNFLSDSDDRALAHSGKKLEDGGVDPWSVKRAFGSRGHEWVRGFFDYSQIELRVLAYYSEDPTMRDVYARGEDIHKRTQVEVFESEEKKWRRLAKVINFGLSYCLSAVGFARQTGLSVDEGEAFMAKFFARYPRIAPFRQEFWAYCRGNGNEFQNLFGRPRRVPLLESFESFERGRAERQAIGSLIQGTAAELTKASLVRLHRWSKAEGIDVRLCNTVHDEIQLDIPRDAFWYVARHTKRLMEDFPMFAPVPIVVDGEWSTTSWADKRSIEGL